MFTIRARLKEKRKQKRIRLANKFLFKKFKKYEPKKKWYSKRFTKVLPKVNTLIRKKFKKVATTKKILLKTNSLNKLSKIKNRLKKQKIFVPKTNFLMFNNFLKPLKNKKFELKNLNAEKENKTKNKIKNKQKDFKGNKNQTNYTNLSPKKRTIDYKYIKKIFFFKSLSFWCIDCSRN